ncbi:hypothetical protein POM88_014036 [Heracleum sosnowskyi]|uniref:Uncharacterized protein n=1 Tax=Heracleum sosnowskyi TaxID=360622 RepID=A0AAD8MYN2_9APIA|nr:hypothetical protein POM88_014036 [Heracleum sosnowskyi]
MLFDINLSLWLWIPCVAGVSPKSIALLSMEHYGCCIHPLLITKLRQYQYYFYKYWSLLNLEQRLVTEFLSCCAFPLSPEVVNKLNDGILHWLERRHPRKFGNVLKGEVETCQQIAQQTGILVDPIYTLAAWEQSTILSREEVGGVKIVMLHTGGTLGMFGLAQRSSIPGIWFMLTILLGKDNYKYKCSTKKVFVMVEWDAWPLARLPVYCIITPFTVCSSVLETRGQMLTALGHGLWPGLVIFSEIVQTFILADFCYYYVKSIISSQHVLRLPAGVV